MTKRTTAVGATLVASLLFGCSGGSKPNGPVDAGGSLEPTFSNVYSAVIREGQCTQGFCHGPSGQGGLRMADQSSAYTALVGVAAQGPCVTDAGVAQPGVVCGCAPSGKTRVVRGDPDASLLYQKLEGTAGCGDRMPGTGTPLAPNRIELVRRWIAAGAKND